MPRTHSSRRARLAVNALEARLAPANFTVLNANDAGAGSLRQAILDANAAAGPDAVVFDPTFFSTPRTITLTVASGQLNVTGDLTITGPGSSILTVNGNNAVQVFNVNGTGVLNVTIADLTITGGMTTTVDGGAINFANENLTLDRVVVSNSSTTQSGGGIADTGGGVLTVRNSTVSGNTAGFAGGGIYFFVSGSLLLENSTVSGNTASGANGGGGVYFFGTVAAGGFTIRNSTLAGNSAPSGGGLALRTLTTAAAPVLIQNSTITGNTSTTTSTTAGFGGGGIALTSASTATITIASSVVSGNAATAANGRSDIAIPASATVNVNFSAIGDADGFTLSGSSGSNLPVGVALGLLPPANNGGPTQTIAFAANSPLRNAGSNLAGLATDQRGAGFPRVVGSAADIGAFEDSTAAVSNVTNLNDSGPGSLRQAIIDSNATPGVAETIAFQVGLTGTITLATPLAITDSVTIAGPGAAVVTVSGNNAVQVFNVNGTGVLNVTITDLTVGNGRMAGNGGGIFTDNENVLLDRVVVSNCTATSTGVGGGSGGGIAVGIGGMLTVRDSTVSGNSAAGRGGGIYFLSGGSLLLGNSTVSGNSAFGANGGGGLYFYGTVVAGGFTIRNSTLAGNTAPSGGGLALRTLTTAAAPVLIQNSTINGNTSTTTSTTAGFGGGGIALTTANTATISIVSTIVSGNTASAANGRSDIAIPAAATVNVNFSAIGDADGLTLSGSSGSNLPFGVDLGLLPLANNGGPTQTIAIAANSPVLNAGANPAGLATDQRGAGFPRVAGGTADIGAFESIFVLVTNLNDNGPGSLRQAILDSNATPAIAESISFLSGLTGVVTLASPLSITSSVTVIGPGAAAVAVSGNNAVQVFNVNGIGVLNVTITDLTITGGRTTTVDGGAINFANENLTLDRVVVSNSSTTQRGGAIATTSDGVLTVRNSTVSGNTASQTGGGVDFYSGGSLLLENSTVSGNSASGTLGGGGVYFNGGVAAGGLTIRNSTLTGNSAPSGGGLALRPYTTYAPALIQNSTITGNTSTTTSTTYGYGGGGIAVISFDSSPVVTIVSSVLSGNTASPANGRSDIAASSSVTVNVNFSAIGDPDGFTLSGTSGSNLPIGAALGLFAPANNGGPTQTIAFAENSPLRDAGANPAGLATDQRGTGFPRVVGSAADIGAFEFSDAPVLIAWDGGPTGNGTLWLDPVNWAGDVVPGTNANVIIGPTGTNPVIQLRGSTSVRSVTNSRSTSIVSHGGSVSTVLTVGVGGFTNTGLVDFVSEGGNFSEQIEMTTGGGTLTNAAGGVIRSMPGNVGAIFVANGVDLINFGTLAGGLDITTGAGSQIANIGTFTVAAGQTLAVGALSNLANGTLYGGIYDITGTFRVQGTINTVSADLRLNGTAAFVINKLTGTNALIGLNTVAPGGFFIGTSNFTASGPFVNSGTVLIGAGITFTAAAGFTNAAGATLGGDGVIVGDVNSPGIVSPGQSPGNLVVNGGITLGALRIELNGPTAGTGYDKLGVNGTVSLNGAMLQLTAGFAATPGSVFLIIENDGTDAIDGTFANSPPGQVLTAGNQSFRISYTGGTGNDLTLTRVPRVDNLIIGDGSAQRSRITSLKIVFDSFINYVGTPESGYMLEKIVNGLPAGNVGIAVATTIVESHSEATITFTSDTTFGSLNDGGYRLTVLANRISSGGQDLAANSVINFHRFYGDMNGDRRVDISDFGFFSLAFLQAPNYNAALDFNGDGRIDIADFGQFSVRFFTTLP